MNLSGWMDEDRNRMAAQKMPTGWRRMLLGAVLAAAVALAPGTVSAQDKYAIPGIDSGAAAVEGSGPQIDSSTAPAGYSNFLVKVVVLGGWAMWPLLALSVLMVGVGIFCLIDLSPRNFFPERLLSALQQDVDRVDLAGTLAHAGKSATCLGRVMHGAAEYIGDRGYRMLDDNGLYDTMAEVSQFFNQGRVRTINILSVIAQSAPMIGLLGTVSGMIKAFDKLGQKGMGDPAQLAANISEALWTTAAGLVIALPALYLYSYFRDRLTSLVGQTDRHAYRLLNRLRRVLVSQTTTPPDSGAMQPGKPPDPALDPQPREPEPETHSD